MEKATNVNDDFYKIAWPKSVTINILDVVVIYGFTLRGRKIEFKMIFMVQWVIKSL